jgi:hypothetical protein
MAARIADRVPRVQAPRALATGLRREFHNCVDTLDRHQLPMATRVARLPAGPASALLATPPLPLSTRETFGGRRLRSEGGILVFQRELALEIGDLPRLLLELFAKPFILLPQPIDFLGVTIRRVVRRLVASRSLLPPSRY